MRWIAANLGNALSVNTLKCIVNYIGQPDTNTYILTSYILQNSVPGVILSIILEQLIEKYTGHAFNCI